MDRNTLLTAIMFTSLLIAGCGSDSDNDSRIVPPAAAAPEPEAAEPSVVGYWLLPPEEAGLKSFYDESSGQRLWDSSTELRKALRLLTDGFFHYRVYELNDNDSLLFPEQYYLECFGFFAADYEGLDAPAFCLTDYHAGGSESGLIVYQNYSDEPPLFGSVKSLSDELIDFEFEVEVCFDLYGLYCQGPESGTVAVWNSRVGHQLMSAASIDGSEYPVKPVSPYREKITPVNPYRANDPAVDLSALAGPWELPGSGEYSLEVGLQANPAEPAAVSGSFYDECAVTGQLTPINSYGRVARLELSRTGCGYAAEMLGVVSIAYDTEGQPAELNVIYGFESIENAIGPDNDNWPNVKELVLTRPSE